MGRVIGDGACFFHIVDIMVDPDYQLTAPSAQGMCQRNGLGGCC